MRASGLVLVRRVVWTTVSPVRYRVFDVHRVNSRAGRLARAALVQLLTEMFSLLTGVLKADAEGARLRARRIMPVARKVLTFIVLGSLTPLLYT